MFNFCICWHFLQSSCNSSTNPKGSTSFPSHRKHLPTTSGTPHNTSISQSCPNQIKRSARRLQIFRMNNQNYHPSSYYRIRAFNILCEKKTEFKGMVLYKQKSGVARIVFRVTKNSSLNNSFQNILNVPEFSKIYGFVKFINLIRTLKLGCFLVFHYIPSPSRSGCGDRDEQGLTDFHSVIKIAMQSDNKCLIPNYILKTVKPFSVINNSQTCMTRR